MGRCGISRRKGGAKDPAGLKPGERRFPTPKMHSTSEDYPINRTYGKIKKTILEAILLYFSLLIVSVLHPAVQRDTASVAPILQRFNLLDNILIKGKGTCHEVDVGNALCPTVQHGEHAVCDCHASDLKQIYLCLDAILIYRGGTC
jgi:hypothetical protein